MKNAFFLIALGVFLFSSCFKDKEPDPSPANLVEVKGQVVSHVDQQPVSGVDLAIKRINLFWVDTIAAMHTDTSGRFLFRIQVEENDRYFVTVCNTPQEYEEKGLVNGVSSFTSLCMGYHMFDNLSIYYLMPVPTIGTVEYKIELVKKPE